MTGSYSFITVHNHPNNNPQKSDADIQSDAYLKQIADLLNITYREGLVITKKQVETIEDPAMKKVRQLDKLVDELAKGKPIEKIKR